MSVFAASAFLPARTNLYVFLEIVLAAFALTCFLAVSRHILRVHHAGTLLHPDDAPPDFSIGGPLGWTFTITICALLYLQNAAWLLLVPCGLCTFLLLGGRTAAEQFGLERVPFRRVLLMALLVCGAVIFVEEPLDTLVQWGLDRMQFSHPEQDNVAAFRQLDRPTKIFSFLVPALLIMPMLEESFFRGFLLTFLKRYTSTWGAIIISAGIFALAHANLGATLQLWMLGIALGAAYQSTGSLLVPIAIHGCWNLVTALALLAGRALT